MNDRDKIKHRLEEASKLEQVESIQYWQSLGTQAIFEAADELIKRHCEELGIEPKLNKRIANFHKGPLRRGE